MQNYNEKSIRIVKSWYKNAQKPINEPIFDYFDRFISLWISFNAFFVAEFYEKAFKLAKNNDPWESKYLEAIYTEESYDLIYLGIIKSKDFKENLDIFMELLKNTSCPGHISDMRRRDNGCENAQEFSDIYNFKQFILIVYRIRCNLFHGNKYPSSDDDIKIVKTIYQLFNQFLTRIYQEEGYLNDSK